MPNLVSPYFGQKSGGDISDFQISLHSPVNGNFHNSRTSDDINIKLGPVTKIDKRNTETSKKVIDDIILTNCDVNVIYLIYEQFIAIHN